MGKAENVLKKKKSFWVRSNPTPSRKFQKTNVKIHKIKKQRSGIILSQNGMREAKNEEKKFLSEFVST